ncbi:beta-ketoacyl synthase N-terminal-like domain-containing protein [Micromonospora sp. CPCC 206061]|uniref:beta-ketoacyl synthase N-terminal-like domain-containing protein n=1 Tax=Micromonospora sp. CPCC 206061 TaxID=3122410 RepID=UPI002FF04161
MARAAVARVGLRLSGVGGTDELAGWLIAREAPVGGDLVDPRMPERIGTRGLRNMAHESRLALAAAAEADPGGPRDAAAVAWASSTAGLTEYATICTEASTLDPGLASPALGPASAFNIPAAMISIRLGLVGPNLTLTGGATAGLSAIAEAIRLIATGDATGVLAGGSAAVSPWRTPSGFISAEGAACLALAPAGDQTNGAYVRTRHRGALDEAALGAAAGLVVATPDTGIAEALAKRLPYPVWHVERTLGDFGAAGGLIAAVCAVALCGETTRPVTILALAIDTRANAVVLEVSSS